MNDPSTKAADSRIDALQKGGRIRPDEADALRQAFAEGRAPEGSPGAAPARSFPPGGRAFLSGQISVDELRRGGRRQALVMGTLFAVWLGITGLWIEASHVPLAERLAVHLPLSALAGAAFGWAMYLVVVRPAVERHVKLREAAGPLRAIEVADAGQCPGCRAEQFDVWTWRKPVMLHWILNPVLAVNELVLGQRIPARPKICRQCGTHSVDCPHCHRAIDGAWWSGRNAFLQWAGLHCPHCQGRLPTLSNGLAWLVRAPFAAIARLFTGRGGRT